jgi:hypothetical protein
LQGIPVIKGCDPVIPGDAGGIKRGDKQYNQTGSGQDEVSPMRFEEKSEKYRQQSDGCQS